MNQTTELKEYQSFFKDGLEQIREMVEMQMKGAALRLVHGLMEEEVQRLCGNVFCRKKETLCHRGGSDRGSVILQGQRISVRKPRVKEMKEEKVLESYEALQNFDVLCNRVMKHMLSGVSTRNYQGLLDELEGGLGLSRSSVSKAFLRGSKQALDEINGRDLSKNTWLALLLDGIHFSNRCVIVVMGITTSGHKHILGLREGDSENWEVGKDLIQSLIERGLSTQASLLFVLDGSKALQKTVRKVFGEQIHIQRCTRHKAQNILSYLPKQYQGEFLRRWKKIHSMAQYQDAKQEYDRLSFWLGQINHQALSSLEESQEETLTLLKLHTPEALRKTLLTTNPIESAFDKVRLRTHRVKNWKSSTDQISRWTAASLLEAEKTFRRIKGYKEIPFLLNQLKTFFLNNERKAA